MDEGPFRGTQHPVGSDADTEPASTSRPVEQPKRHTEQKPVHRSQSHQSSFGEKKSNKKIFGIVGAVVGVLFVGWLAFTLVSNLVKPSPTIDNSKYQAVFFTNGQVYFGKLQDFSDEYMKLKEVYYLQTQASETDEKDSKNPQQSSTNQNNTTLIKLGDEVHGPEDEMIISKDQVLFYENLKKDGKVSQSIEKYKNPN